MQLPQGLHCSPFRGCSALARYWNNLKNCWSHESPGRTHGKVGSINTCSIRLQFVPSRDTEIFNRHQFCVMEKSHFPWLTVKCRSSWNKLAIQQQPCGDDCRQFITQLGRRGSDLHYKQSEKPRLEKLWILVSRHHQYDILIYTNILSALTLAPTMAPIEKGQQSLNQVLWILFYFLGRSLKRHVYFEINTSSMFLDVLACLLMDIMRRTRYLIYMVPEMKSFHRQTFRSASSVFSCLVQKKNSIWVRLLVRWANRKWQGAALTIKTST